MNNLQRNSITTFLISIVLATANPVLANTQINIDYETPSFKNRELISELVRVSVSYNKRENTDSANNLHYQIYYNGVPQINSSDFTTTIGSVALKDLDGNGISEVIIKTFSGGAHCCTNLNIYTWNNNEFIKLETGFLDSEGGTFQDLDGDGKFEFSTLTFQLLCKPS